MKKAPLNWPKDELLSCLYTLAEGIRLIAVAIKPVMPEISDKILASFGILELNVTKNSFTVGGLAGGNNLGNVVTLFPRID